MNNKQESEKNEGSNQRPLTLNSCILPTGLQGLVSCLGKAYAIDANLRNGL